ncbi:MAG TPA: LemA family protein [Myxococcales bacterium]|nr:LemA family protein [Myxococcales bacterium]
MRGALIAVVVAVVLVGLWAASANNSLVKLDQGVKQSWSQVENVYQRRMDLIPNLVETVKGVSNFEKETYAAVADARARASSITISPELLNDPQKFQQFEQAQNQLSGSLGRLLVVSERYPELKANQSFEGLLAELAGTENRIAVERRRFNESVGEYNVAVNSFPTRIMAGMLGFREKPYFTALQGADRPPAVKF